MSTKTGGKRLVKSKSGLKMVSQHDREAAPWEMAEPPWVPDVEVQQCSSCSTKFDFIRRKHHCRRCGQIYCSKCCSLKVQFHRMGFVDPVRHCLPCATVTKSEEDFFLNHIKLLFSGAPFHVSSSSSSPMTSPSSEDSPPFSPTSSISGSGSKLYHCKLSSDQRSLLFDPYDVSSSESGSTRSGAEERRIRPVEISKVQYSEIFHAEEEDRKGPGNGLTIHVKIPGDEELMAIRMMSPAEPSKKPSVLFIAALQKGLNMTIDSRKLSSRTDSPDEIEPGSA